MLCDEELELPIKMKASKIVQVTPESYKRVKKILKENNPSIPIEEERLMITETRKLCETNIDLFEQFYRENKELYEDITSKVLKIKLNTITRLMRK